MSTAKDIIGQRFGRLLVVERHGTRGSAATWLCVCDCGVRRIVFGFSLRSGATRSCGCLGAELTVQRQMKHGDGRRGAKIPEYTAWEDMIDRCHNPNCRNYRYYGARGISVCDRWRSSYENFLSDMGRRPSPQHSIDRKNVNDNYEPLNCRWATRKEQSRNTRANRLLTYGGETHCLAEWAELVGIVTTTLKKRLDSGWTMEQALTTPVKSGSPSGIQGVSWDQRVGKWKAYIRYNDRQRTLGRYSTAEAAAAAVAAARAQLPVAALKAKGVEVPADA